MIYILIIFGVMVLDRIAKTVVNSSMHVGDTVPVIGDFFHITYVRNTGAAFSMLQGHPLLLLILPSIIILIAILFIIVKYKSYKPIFMIALALICGGGLGNLTDRAAYGYVVDMFDFGSFPVFNVADICVCVGCGLMMLYLIVYNNKNPGMREDTLKGSKTVQKPNAPDVSTPDKPRAQDKKQGSAGGSNKKSSKKSGKKLKRLN